MCFVTKKIKELMGRRDSTLEQVHREQKGKKDTQHFLGHQVQPAASMLHPSGHRFMHSSPTFRLTISLQRWAPQLPTWQPPCLLSLWSTPAISSQARLVLPACLPPSHARPAPALTEAIASASAPQTWQASQSPTSQSQFGKGAAPLPLSGLSTPPA